MEPTRSRWLRRIDVVSVVMLLAASSFLLYRVVQTSSRSRSRPAAQRVYTQDEALEAVPELRFASASSTAVVVLSAECPYCRQSLPLYLELSSLARDSRGALRLVFVATGDEAATRGLLREGGLSEPDLVARPKKLRVGGVPMVLLVDSAAKVRGVWMGLLEGAARADLLERARAAASSSS